MAVARITESHRLQALALANTIRLRRKDLKAHLRAGRVSLASVLRSDKDYTQTMQLFDLLLATPGIGRVKADRALIACKIGPSVRLENLSAQRRENLLAWLGQRYPALELAA